jgi:DNA replication protein DnaC
VWKIARATIGGYLPFAQTGGQLLFHLISRLYERTSVIVTANLAFGDWQSADDVQPSARIRGILKNHCSGADSKSEFIL